MCPEAITMWKWLLGAQQKRRTHWAASGATRDVPWLSQSASLSWEGRASSWSSTHSPSSVGQLTICCLWEKELNSASCRENNYQVGGDGYFHSTTSCLRCEWQGKDAPHSTESPNSILTEHSHPWVCEVVYFQGVGTKGACGNSLSNQHLFLAMAVTIADEASVTPRPSIFWNSRDAVSTGWGNWVFSIILPWSQLLTHGCCSSLSWFGANCFSSGSYFTWRMALCG